MTAAEIFRPRLDAITRNPDNAYCADCSARAPRWSSVKLGILICANCAGIHRKLGTHISFVQSVTIDKWKLEWVELCEKIGNRLSNKYYEAIIPEHIHKPSFTDDGTTGGDTMDPVTAARLEKWLRNKYEYKLFVAPDTLSPTELIQQGINPEEVYGTIKKKKKKKKDIQELLVSEIASTPALANEGGFNSNSASIVLPPGDSWKCNVFLSSWAKSCGYYFYLIPFAIRAPWLCVLVLIAASMPSLNEAVGLGMIRSMSLPVPSLHIGSAPVMPLGLTSVTEETLESSLKAAAETAKNTTQLSSKILPPEPASIMDREDFEFIIKVLAIVSNVVLQLSPMRQVIQSQLQEHVSCHAFPLVALTACGYQWSYYGYFAYSVTENAGFLMLLYANILGLVLGVYYLCMLGSRDSSMRIQLWVAVAIFSIEYLYCSRSAVSTSAALYVSGGLSAVLSIVVSASPLVAIPELVAQKKLFNFPTDLCVASTVSSVLWLWCGYLLRDPWVWLPNLCGVVVGIAQLLTVVCMVNPFGWKVEKGLWLSRLKFD